MSTEHSPAYFTNVMNQRVQSMSLRPINFHTVCRHQQRCARPARRHSCTLCQATPLVYVATLPLVGWESLETILQDKYPNELALHCMVLVETGEYVTVFDFLPQLPKSPVVAAALLCGRQVKGVVRERSLSQLPARRCWLVGPSTQQQVKLALLTLKCLLSSNV